jgi:hypothetical protein
MACNKLIRKTVLVLSAALLLILLGEIGLRVAYQDRFGIRPRFYISDDLLGWKAESNLDHTYYGRDFTCEIKTDSDGYRLGTLGTIDYSKDLVLLAGDSYVFSWGVSTDESMASYLEEALYEASGRKVRIVNLGVGGYGTLQNFLRLRQFFQNHPNAKVAAVVVFHSPNDAADNLQSIGCHLGAQTVTNKPMKARSRFHFVNFIHYTIDRFRTRNETPLDEIEDKTMHPYLADNLVHSYFQDILFSHQFVQPRSVPSKAEFNGYPISFAGLNEEDYSSEVTLKRGTFTELQKDLILIGVNSIHQLLATKDAKVFHIIVPTSPDEITGEFITLLTQSIPSGDNPIMIVGRYPDDISDFSQNVISNNWARHYSADFNKYWAEKIYTLVNQAVIGRR